MPEDNRICYIGVTNFIFLSRTTSQTYQFHCTWLLYSDNSVTLYKHGMSPVVVQWDKSRYIASSGSKAIKFTNSCVWVSLTSDVTDEPMTRKLKLTFTHVPKLHPARLKRQELCNMPACLLALLAKKLLQDYHFLRRSPDRKPSVHASVVV